LAHVHRPRLTYANVVATLALFVALGGGSYAAIKVTGRNVPRDALTGADIKNLTGRDVRNNSLTGADVARLTTADVANGRLLAEDFAPGQLPSGARGEQGPPGQAATRLWAVVDAADTAADTKLRRGSGVTGLERVAIGLYQVEFDRSVRDCSQSATIAEILPSNVEGRIQARTKGDSPADPNLTDQEVEVAIARDIIADDRDFSIQVFC
jgi:hypothetical protein